MSGLPPKIDTTEPGTPANEWARTTTTAAFARTEAAPALSSSANDSSVAPTTAGVSLAAANDAQKPPFDPKTYNMNPATPGAEFPGAYPVTPGEQAANPQIPVSTESVKETAQSAAETASKFAQSAAQAAAQYLPTGVVETVSSYMPNTTATMNAARASEHDPEHVTSLPTRELMGAGNGEHTAGVGSLPGAVTESGVTKLPDEREDSEKYPTTAGVAATIAGVAYAAKDRVLGSVPSAQDAQAAKETAKEKVQHTAQVAKQAAPAIPGVTSSTTTAVTASTVPSRELFGAQPGDHSSGAGALPGYQDEPHVARLPEESAHPQYDSGPMDTAAQVSLKPSEEATGNESAVGEARHVGGVGALVGNRDESSVALAPDERAGQNVAGVIGGASRTLPTQESQGNEAPGAPRHVGGVGALVGGRDEQGATVLPDERVRQQGTGTGTVTQPKQQESAPPAPPKEDKKTHSGQPELPKKHQEHVLPGDPGNDRFAAEQDRDEDGKPRETQANLLQAGLRPRAHALGAERARWGGVPLNGDAARQDLDTDFPGPHGEGEEGDAYDTDYHPAQLHPATGGYDQHPASEGEKSLGATQADANRPAEEGRPPHQARDHSGEKGEKGEKAKKAGFMDKMKGEAKVLLGKIEGKHEKVEQGQKMKAGEA